MLDLKGKKVILCGICLTLDKEVAQNCWWELGGKSRDLALLLFLSPSLLSQRNGCSQPFQSRTPPPTVTSPLPFPHAQLLWEHGSLSTNPKLRHSGQGQFFGNSQKQN